jgi:hypothetical protein
MRASFMLQVRLQSQLMASPASISAKSRPQVDAANFTSECRVIPGFLKRTYDDLES